jgi:hypothetical protein
MPKVDLNEVERMFAQWCAIDPGCAPNLTPAQLQRVLCFAEYVRTMSQKVLVATSVETVNM